MTPGAPATIAACLKWVDRRPQVDSLTGAVQTDPRSSGASDADLAALEWALRLGEAWNASVIVTSAGPAATEPMLREALSVGATRAIRVDMDLTSPSASVAAALAKALPGDVGTVVCGAWSLDRGSGSVPAFLAAELDTAQALGLISLQFSAGEGQALEAYRRLDGGRREYLGVNGRAVLSVEGGSARLRRAPLGGVLAARDATVEVVPASVGAASSVGAGGAPGGYGSVGARGAPGAPGAAGGHGVAAGTSRTMAYRPRPRVLAGPAASLSARERVLALTGALVERTPPQRLTLDPPDAADRILAQLRTWGYLE